ncbi:hypothetical protein BSLG_006866 [Batrachochytrium salamandrivorans]|nr:hypothetical protein BSLG_006866 [Batrachochytrium salamandrivorans]
MLTYYFTDHSSRHFPPKRRRQVHGFSVRIIAARNLYRRDAQYFPNPYAVFHMLPDPDAISTQQTRIQTRTNSPTFSETFFLDQGSLADGEATGFLGHISIPLRKVIQKHQINEWYWLNPISNDSGPSYTERRVRMRKKSLSEEEKRNRPRDLVKSLHKQEAVSPQTRKSHQFAEVGMAFSSCANCNGVMIGTHLQVVFICSRNGVDTDYFIIIISMQIVLAGAVRLWFKLTETIVMPLEYYSRFLTLLQDNSYFIPVILGKVSQDREDAARNSYFETSDTALRFLKAAVAHEILLAPDSRTLFRANSMASKAVDVFMKHIALKYLKSVLEGPILEIAIERILLVLQETVSKKFENDPIVRYTCISGFIFLRFFAPAVLGPRLFGLDVGEIDSRSARNLLLVAKTLQNLSNLVEFGQKELYMAPMNVFIKNNMGRMKRFIESISVRDTILDLDEKRRNLLSGTSEGDLDFTPWLSDNDLSDVIDEGTSPIDGDPSDTALLKEDEDERKIMRMLTRCSSTSMQSSLGSFRHSVDIRESIVKGSIKGEPSFPSTVITSMNISGTRWARNTFNSRSGLNVFGATHERQLLRMPGRLTSTNTANSAGSFTRELDLIKPSEELPQKANGPSTDKTVLKGASNDLLSTRTASDTSLDSTGKPTGSRSTRELLFDGTLSADGGSTSDSSNNGERGSMTSFRRRARSDSPSQSPSMHFSAAAPSEAFNIDSPLLTGSQFDGRGKSTGEGLNAMASEASMGLVHTVGDNLLCGHASASGDGNGASSHATSSPLSMLAIPSNLGSSVLSTSLPSNEEASNYCVCSEDSTSSHKQLHRTTPDGGGSVMRSISRKGTTTRKPRRRTLSASPLQDDMTCVACGLKSAPDCVLTNRSKSAASFGSDLVAMMSGIVAGSYTRSSSPLSSGQTSAAPGSPELVRRVSPRNPCEQIHYDKDIADLIYAEYLVVNNANFHVACRKCDTCGSALSGKEHFTLGDQVFCSDHRDSIITCHACHQRIDGEVLIASVFLDHGDRFASVGTVDDTSAT